MKKAKNLLLTGVLVAGPAALLPGVTAAQSQPQSYPPYQSTQSQGMLQTKREALVITYPEGRAVGVHLRGNERLPGASGEAKVERKEGVTKIEVELDEMKSAVNFGGDMNTYVLWVIAREGTATNAGELKLDGNRSKLSVTTPLQECGMIITAEPHFAVTQPSNFVVMESTWPTGESPRADLEKVQYQGYAGTYEFDRENLMNVPEPAKGREMETELAQARTAIKLAERAGAEASAAEQLGRARQAFEQARAASAAGNVEMMRNHAREAVRLAFEAQHVAQGGAPVNPPRQ